MHFDQQGRSNKKGDFFFDKMKQLDIHFRS